VSQLDCTASLCYETCDIESPTLPLGEVFINGVEQFVGSDGNVRYMLIGNSTGRAYNLLCEGCVPIECRYGPDSPVSDVLWVNSSQGGPCGVVEISSLGPLSFFINNVPGGTGKFVAHLNRGLPDATTITPLSGGLGDFCFPLFCPANPAVHKGAWNTIGLFATIGYNAVNSDPCLPPNGTPPPPAPSFFHLFTPVPAWMPLGSEWTLQAVIQNPAASSSLLHSVTNAVGFRIF
jgi:hypothetical protein